MSESKYLLEQAKRAATKAINAERDKQYKVAFNQFLSAAEALNHLIVTVSSQKLRDSYYKKAKEYISRAKEIKLIMAGPSEPAMVDDSPRDLPSPPKDKKAPLPPPPEEKKTLPPPPKETKTPPPPPPKDQTAKMMRGEGDDDTPTPSPKSPQTKPAPSSKSPPPSKVNLPTRTTFEILFDEGKYRECVYECAKSVEAELRVRLGLFDEHLTLGMLIERGLKKGIEILREFKFVNILLNRIEHENYRPKPAETQKAVEITVKIVMS
ncbi:MAG: hypothetical protein ACTSQB_05520 [Candidatus Heimdallarchaeota archaeon]